MQRVVDIYRSGKHEGMYVYIEHGASVDELPEALMQRFGVAHYAMSLTLTPDKKLAAANAADVIASIKEQGFYLQMPPRPDIPTHTMNNDKLPIT